MDNTAVLTNEIDVVVFYKNGLPKAIDTKANWIGGAWNNIYPKWWDGFITVKGVPSNLWDEGKITLGNIENYK